MQMLNMKYVAGNLAKKTPHGSALGGGGWAYIYICYVAILPICQCLKITILVSCNNKNRSFFVDCCNPQSLEIQDVNHHIRCALWNSAGIFMPPSMIDHQNDQQPPAAIYSNLQGSLSGQQTNPPKTSARWIHIPRLLNKKNTPNQRC